MNRSALSVTLNGRWCPLNRRRLRLSPILNGVLYASVALCLLVTYRKVRARPSAWTSVRSS
nr:MAG TPA: hypothetical protein [Caudoviricetes sp.]